MEWLRGESDDDGDLGQPVGTVAATARSGVVATAGGSVHAVAPALAPPLPFAAAPWRGFEGFGLDGKGPGAVAAELGISTNAVRIAKSRVLSRFRQDAEGLID